VAGLKVNWPESLVKIGPFVFEIFSFEICQYFRYPIFHGYTSGKKWLNLIFFVKQVISQVRDKFNQNRPVCWVHSLVPFFLITFVTSTFRNKNTASAFDHKNLCQKYFMTLIFFTISTFYFLKYFLLK
jgi:hypothetical protein